MSDMRSSVVVRQFQEGQPFHLTVSHGNTVQCTIRSHNVDHSLDGIGYRRHGDPQPLGGTAQRWALESSDKPSKPKEGKKMKISTYCTLDIDADAYAKFHDIPRNTVRAHFKESSQDVLEASAAENGYLVGAAPAETSEELPEAEAVAEPDEGEDYLAEDEDDDLI